jgi:dephospho-CoA kinase
MGASMHETWVFGYGSLVSPVSLATTIGRVVDPVDVAVATLAGFGRRWNYGAKHVRAQWTHDGVDVSDGVMVALGLEASPAETCNGVLVRVTEDDLVRLDRRERDYDRTDVTDQITVGDPVTGIATASPKGARFVTYVPRSSAVERYLAARDAQRAAIRQSYWDLVRDAFDELGGDHAVRYATTLAPDVPVVEMTWSVDA